MKPRGSNVFFLSVLVFVTAVKTFAGSSLPLLPINGKSVSLLIGEKEKTYFLLSKTNPIRIEVDGPTKVQVVGRLLFPKEVTNIETYAVTVKEGNKIIKEYHTSTEPGEGSTADSKYITGKSRKFSIDVPEGTHTYILTLEKSNLSEVAMRFSTPIHKSSAGGADKSTRLEPVSYDRTVTAVVSEKLITYYVCSKEKSIQLRVVGPTRVDVDARLNYHSKMQGEQKYALAVSEGVKRIKLASFTCTKSLGSIYQDWKEVIPGKINRMSFSVPVGEHIYHLTLEESSALSVAMKFSIPLKDTKNEK